MKNSHLWREVLAFSLGGVLVTAVIWTLRPESPPRLVVEDHVCATRKPLRESGVQDEKAAPLGKAQSDPSISHFNQRNSDYASRRSGARLAIPKQNLDLLSDDELRLRSRSGDIDAMLSLSERLFAPDAPIDGHEKGFALLDEAGARGSIKVSSVFLIWPAMGVSKLRDYTDLRIATAKPAAMCSAV